MFWDSLVLHEWEPWQSRSLYPDSSRRHCTMCSFVLWSDQVSWHVFSQHPPDAALEVMGGVSWQSSHVDRRIMERWISKPDQVIVPEKVKQREEKNLFSCVKNIMRRQEKRGTLFHSAPENEEARNWCQLCFISLSVKSLCHFFLHRKLLKKIHHCAHTYENIITCLNDWRPVALTPIFSKCFEKLIRDHICSVLPASLDPLQFAYRRNRSTDDAIAFTLHTALSHLEIRTPM